MKNSLYILLIFPCLIYSQQNEIWDSFYEGNLMGFKNSKGEIIIKPKFMGTTVAKNFDKVIAVMEEIDSLKWDSYYLLKNGHKFGKDSVYVSDYSNACESEGFIKFKDHVQDLIGMFNANGNIAIPALYNEVTPVRNGYFIALKGAKKEYWEAHNHSGCNHWSWKGGKEYLIDTSNNIIIDDFKHTRKLNFYSLKISKTKNIEKARVNFKGRNGLFYSFVDNKLLFEIEFEKLLNKLTKENLLNNSFEQIVFFNETGWTYLDKEEYLEKKYNLIVSRLKKINSKNIKCNISIDDIIHLPDELEYIFDDKRDNCGSINTFKYPIINVIVTHEDKNGKYLFQDHFNFIKHSKQYKLISINLGDK